ncbi:DUF222 domain-containing protein [Microbacterium sp. NPDC058342]|uniref:HNH endonuclease n=1 Tax=Microbacterium sp. NPDC058342 TaxID=3346454 RepID=UPI003648DA01
MTALMDVSVEQVTTLDELVDLAQGVHRSITSMQAGLDGVLALASRWAMSAAGDADEADIAFRSVAAELGAALHVSDRTVQRRMSEAEFKVDRFPLVWAAQGAGRISAGHARVIVDAGDHLDDPQAREAYSVRVLELAEDESPNRLRPIAARIAEQYQPRSLEERHADAREERRVWTKDAADGMAELGVLGPAALVHAAFERITGMAKADAASSTVACGAAFGPGSTRGAAPVTGEDDEAAANTAPAAVDPRTLSQKRADLALDLLLTGAPAGHDTTDGLLAAIVPHVSVTVPVTTLIGAEGVATPPAELNGRIPIDIETAGRLAGAASGWDRILTDPITGALLAVDRYRPSAQMRRRLQARDQRCRFACCGLPARDNDLDHTLDAALGGPTDEANLAGLCRRHHILKHHSPWHVEQLGDGLLAWTSPTGRVYIDRPPPQNTVIFADADADAVVRADADAGVRTDTGVRTDAGVRADTGSDTDPPPDSGDTVDPWAAVPGELLALF